MLCSGLFCSVLLCSALLCSFLEPLQYNFLRPRLLLHSSKLECLPLAFISILVLYLQARLEPSRLEPLKGVYSNGRLFALPTNARLGLE